MRLYNCHTHIYPPTSTCIFQSNGEPYPHPYSVGIPPWQAGEISFDFLEAHLQDPYCVALGELGFDGLRGVEFSVQRHVFISQIHLANRFQKPVILHLVKAWHAFHPLMKKMQQTPWVFHGFNQPKLWEEVLHSDLFVSIGPAALRNPHMFRIFPEIPPHRLLLETDDDPMPLEAVYAEFSRLSGQPLENVVAQVEKNFLSIFGA